MYRLEFIYNVDRIIVMKNGEIAENGTAFTYITIYIYIYVHIHRVFVDAFHENVCMYIPMCMYTYI